MTYTAVTFTKINNETEEIIIAILSNAGFEGFEQNEEEITCFIKSEDFDETILKEITASYHLAYSLSEIQQQNWNAQWESSFDPVIVDDFAAVRAGFHQPVTGVKHEIIITPKMSFGTGHHATTYLMMQQMSYLNFNSKSVFDFGTGTGVLAILAEKMGAIKVDAIDIDEWSVENTRENIVANYCHTISIENAEKISQQSHYDIVLANINLNVLLANMQDIAAICNPGAVVLFSGILKADELTLKESAIINGLIFSTVTERNGWLCIKAIVNR